MRFLRCSWEADLTHPLSQVGNQGWEERAQLPISQPDAAWAGAQSPEHCTPHYLMEPPTSWLQPDGCFRVGAKKSCCLTQWADLLTSCGRLHVGSKAVSYSSFKGVHRNCGEGQILFLEFWFRGNTLISLNQFIRRFWDFNQVKFFCAKAKPNKLF